VLRRTPACNVRHFRTGAKSKYRLRVLRAEAASQKPKDNSNGTKANAYTSGGSKDPEVSSKNAADSTGMNRDGEACRVPSSRKTIGKTQLPTRSLHTLLN
jgi:hypothetical protein